MKRKKKSLNSCSIGGEAYWTVRDLSAKVGIGERALANYIRSGELAARKVSGAWLISETAMSEFFGRTQEV